MLTLLTGEITPIPGLVTGKGLIPCRLEPAGLYTHLLATELVFN